MNKIPNIALVGNAPKEKHELLNNLLSEEVLTDLCSITLYGADGQPEQEALRDAIDDWHNGDIDGIVCLPMATSIRKTIREQLPEECDKAVILQVNDAICLASVKGDVTPGDVAETLKIEDVKEAVKQTEKALQRDMMKLKPRIAVLSLNKEITDSDTAEELSIIAPAVSELVKEGVQAFGPLLYPTFFADDKYKAYDAVVEMYHDQCAKEHLLVSNSASFTMLSGIDTPMAFAEPEAIATAMFAIIDAIRNRREYDRPFHNPLQKLYHERKEDGDKARFAVKKKGFNPAEHRRENVTFTTYRPDAAKNNSESAQQGTAE